MRHTVLSTDVTAKSQSFYTQCATGVVDTGGAPLLANISANSKKFETVLMGYSGDERKLIHGQKIRSKKSRDTVPLKGG